MLKFENVSKKFFQADFFLEELNFNVEKGEFLFITGPSGAGKTTILRLIIRDLLPTSGRIFFNEWEISKKNFPFISKLRQKITIVFQDFKLLTDRTVFENVALPLEIIGTPEDKIRKEVKNILELTSLSDKLNLFPAQLSGGELQRTCLARALVGKPEILLADEPTGNLDPATSWEILELLLQANKMGTTVIMATHNIDIVNSLKKRVITLDKGKVIKDEKEGKYEIT